MKKIENLELLVYSSNDDFNFEELEPVAVFNTWQDLDYWMLDKFKEAYHIITHGEIVEQPSLFCEEWLDN